MKSLKYIIFMFLFSIPVLTRAQYTPTVLFTPIPGQNCCFDIDLNNWGAATALNCFQIKIINNNTQQTYIVSTDPASGYTTDPSSIQPQTTIVKWLANEQFPLSWSVKAGRICFTQHSVQNNFPTELMWSINKEET